jgi:hypothetical protein
MSARVPGIGPVLAVGLAGGLCWERLELQQAARSKNLFQTVCPLTNYLFTRTPFARAAPCSLPWQTVPSSRKQLAGRSKTPAQKASIERDICGDLAFETWRRKNTNEPAATLRTMSAIFVVVLKQLCMRTTATNPTKAVATSCAIDIRTITRATLFSVATNAEAPIWKPSRNAATKKFSGSKLYRVRFI